MLFVAISDLKEISQVSDEVDAIEIRVDLLPTLDLTAIAAILQTSKKPILFTLRSLAQGGQFSGSEEERESLVNTLLELQPAFIDLENDMRPDFIKHACKNYPHSRVILSYHNFDETPKNLEDIYKQMSRFPVHGYKIAVHNHSTIDALRLLLFGKTKPKMSVIGMGECGEFTRVLGPVCGNLFNYACLSESQRTAPGQLTVEELIQIYGFPKLNSSTHLYGLIGDPVNKSRGHLYHNHYYRSQGWNSVYVKMKVKPEEIPEVLPLAVKLGFRGISVTMPLKEAVIPFIDEIDPAAVPIGAINTIVIQDQHVKGFNTDGVGALDAIEAKLLVKNKKVVLVGAGGAARAIAFEASRRGAAVLILNRTYDKAQELAKDIGCQAGDLDQIPIDYDILVNTTPDGSFIDSKKLLASAVVMDIVYAPRETPLLKHAAARGCQLVYGDDMFFSQAYEQIKLGFGN